MPVHYKELTLENAVRLDLLVEKRLIVELKSVESLLPLHQAQLLTYRRVSVYRAAC